jgi:hypothetical protein
MLPNMPKSTRGVRHNWTAEAKEQLFSIIIQMYVDKVDYEAVAAKIGQGVTPSAVQKQFLKAKGPSREGKLVPKTALKMETDCEKGSDGKGDMSKEFKKES